MFRKKHQKIYCQNQNEGQIMHIKYKYGLESSYIVLSQKPKLFSRTELGFFL